jgi:hypothetical protein
MFEQVRQSDFSREDVADRDPSPSADSPHGTEVFSILLQKQHKDGGQPSPTLALLFASLACELDCETGNNDILAHLNAMIVRLNGQAALVEALLVGMTKISLCHPVGNLDMLPSLPKVSEGTSSSLLHFRLDQLRKVLQDGSPGIKLPSGNLLDTMDRIDAYFATKESIHNTDKRAAATTSHQLKPLKYDPYSESTTLTPPSSSSNNKPFSALPPPSIAQDSRARRQRKQKEDDVRMEMQKGIARLTLGADDESDEEEQDKSVEAAKDGVLI